jgi:DNA repair protein RecO (recombination protein O)
MIKQFTASGILLSRTNFGEADRIITFITPDHGKVRAIAKAVRKSKSKLAGGIELFSVSELGLINGRGEIRTLIHSRLITHYGNIVKNLERTQLAYELMRIINKATEDAAESEYFNLLNEGLTALDNHEINIQIIETWFYMRLLKMTGHGPNLHEDIDGKKLDIKSTYNFNIDRMCFAEAEGGQGMFNCNHIKLLRLGFSAQKPSLLQRVQCSDDVLPTIYPLVQAMLKTFIRI